MVTEAFVSIKPLFSGLTQVLGSSLRGAERRSNPASFVTMDCFASLAMTAGSGNTSGGSLGHHPLPARSVQARDVRAVRQALAYHHSPMRRRSRRLLDAA